MPRGLRCSAPLKMTSSIVPPRRDLALCSPSTQVMASDRLLLPHPFGPTMAVIPPANSTRTGSTNDLNPEISSRLTFSMFDVPLASGREDIRGPEATTRCGGGWFPTTRCGREAPTSPLEGTPPSELCRLSAVMDHTIWFAALAGLLAGL